MFRFTTTLAGSLWLLASLSVSARGASITYHPGTYHSGLLGGQDGWQAVNGSNPDAVVVANPGEVEFGTQAAELVPTADAHLLRPARKP
jgi:hypothetical protein